MTTPSVMTRTTARAFSIAATMALLVTPMAGHTDPDPTRSDKARSDKARWDQAMDTCISAFITANLPKEQPVRVRKEEVGANVAEAHGRSYTVVLTAMGATSGRRLVKGTCTVNRRGEVIFLNSKPMTTQLAATTPATAQKTVAR